MEEYVTDALHHGTSRPSTSPAAVGQDSRLHPCIDNQDSMNQNLSPESAHQYHPGALTRPYNQHFTLTPDATQAFICLCTLFISAPISLHPDPTKPFVAEVGA